MAREELEFHDYVTALTAISSMGGTERIPMMIGGVAKYGTPTQIVGLVGGISSVGDFNIASTSHTTSLSAITALGVGAMRRVSWHSGDGSDTFSFTGTAGITIDGIASSEYTGEGVGHLDLLVVTSVATVTINRGEIWDSNYTNTADDAFNYEKYLSGNMRQWCWGYAQGDGGSSTPTQTLTYQVAFADTNQVITQTAGPYKNTTPPTSQTDITGSSVYYAKGNILSTTQAEVVVDHRDNTAIASTRYVFYFCSVTGRWTTGTPRIT